MPIAKSSHGFPAAGIAWPLRLLRRPPRPALDLLMWNPGRSLVLPATPAQRQFPRRRGLQKLTLHASTRWHDQGCQGNHRRQSQVRKGPPSPPPSDVSALPQSPHLPRRQMTLVGSGSFLAVVPLALRSAHHRHLGGCHSLQGVHGNVICRASMFCCRQPLQALLSSAPLGRGASMAATMWQHGEGQWCAVRNPNGTTWRPVCTSAHP